MAGRARVSLLPVTLVQNAYLVRNLEEGCAALNRTFGWGPFLGGTEGVLADHVYRGKPTEPIRIRGVFVQTGAINVEVIEVVSRGPSAFHEMLRADGQPVLHHCASFAADYDATRDHLVAQGYQVVSEFGFAGRRICYVDTRRLLGFMTEVYPELPVIRAMYEEAREAAAARPGDPGITPFATPR
ncbi:VOC family protein [Erythrobacter sp. NE805]|uniref:VOC family protein n=1 Tax=Erythrobacter sp. NE805 TaxID=3389875 RepID=UPI00396B020B